MTPSPASDEIITFPQGLPGFESCRQFVLLSSSELAPLHCLQGVGGPPVSFIGIDPRWVVPDYRCELDEGDRARLGGRGGEPLVWLALIAPGENGDATVNLRAPVVIDPGRMTGCQVVPQDSPYPLRHPLPLD